MERIFQKYVTPEGRSETPPTIVDSALRQVSSGPRPGEEVKTKLGGSSITMSDMKYNGQRNGQREEPEENEDINKMTKGIRNMMQFFTRLSKLVQEFG
jgi:hypothetical protein